MIDAPERIPDPDELPEPVRAMFLKASRQFVETFEAGDDEAASRWGILALALGRFPVTANR